MWMEWLTGPVSSPVDSTAFRTFIGDVVVPIVPLECRDAWASLLRS